MSRYIDADLLLAKCRRNPMFEKLEQDKGMIYIERSIIDDTPTADVVEVRHGHWITHTHFYECSNCEFIYQTDVIAFDYNPITDFDLHYCSVCGAKMDGERREG